MPSFTSASAFLSLDFVAGVVSDFIIMCSFFLSLFLLLFFFSFFVVAVAAEAVLAVVTIDDADADVNSCAAISPTVNMVAPEIIFRRMVAAAANLAAAVAVAFTVVVTAGVGMASTVTNHDDANDDVNVDLVLLFFLVVSME